MKIALKPALLRWARQRAGLSEEDLAHRVGVRQEKVFAWERDGILTFIKAEKLAKATRTPFAYLYLNEPPHEELPIADCRRLTTEKEERTSPDLLELLYIAQRRQDWFRDYLVSHDEKSLSFVGSVSVMENPTEVAGKIRETVGFDTEIRSAATTWGEALKLQIEQIENSGVLVMRSGIVGNNVKRKLSVEEFRGFALADPYAPLIFINAQDAKAAQMFTLVHEAVHVWLGESGVSNLTRTYAPTTNVERFCNKNFS